MLTRSVFAKLALFGMVLAAGLCFMAPGAYAQDDHGEEAVEATGDDGLGAGLKAMGLALGAGIAVAGAGLATGRAQASVGAGGTGAMAERPELFTNVLILFAIPETIVVLGFVIAFLLLGQI